MPEPTPIPYIRREDLTREVRDIIEARGDVTHLWSDDWSPEFYEAQARLGMIAVSLPRESTVQEAAPGYVILPELQEAYAVLDWPDLRPDKDVYHILKFGRMKSEPISLEIDTHPGRVLDEIHRFWGDQSWLCPPYRNTLIQLARQAAAEISNGRDPAFRLWGVRLTAGPNGETAAGELGYTIGRTYTSLTGFHHRRREWNNLGKLQLVLLARRLKEAGIAFWNLGHPSMPYKTRLGARILSRREFLERWDPDIQGPAADILP